MTRTQHVQHDQHEARWIGGARCGECGHIIERSGVRWVHVGASAHTRHTNDTNGSTS